MTRKPRSYVRILIYRTWGPRHYKRKGNWDELTFASAPGIVTVDAMVSYCVSYWPIRHLHISQNAPYLPTP